MDGRVVIALVLAIVIGALNSKCSREDGGDTPGCTITRIC